MTTHEPLIAGLSPARLDLLSRLVRAKGRAPQAARTDGAPIGRVAHASELPLSFAQERMWFIDQLEPESAAYNVPGGVELKGRLSVAALQQSLSELVRRHEVLRARFVDVAGQPMQRTA